MTRRRHLLRAAGVALVGGVAGCSALGSSPSETPAPVEKNVGMSCKIDEDRYFFSPAVREVPVGGSLSWAPTSECRQAVFAYHPDNDAPLRIPEDAASFDSTLMQGNRGGTFTHRFEVEGVYDYFGLHEGFGQVGTVVVGDPDPAGEPGLSEPGEELPDAARERLRALNEQVRTMLAE